MANQNALFVWNLGAGSAILAACTNGNGVGGITGGDDRSGVAGVNVSYTGQGYRRIGVSGLSFDGDGVVGEAFRTGGVGVVGLSATDGMAGLFDSHVHVGGGLGVRGDLSVWGESVFFGNIKEPFGWGDTVFEGAVVSHKRFVAPMVIAPLKLFHIDHPLDPANRYLNHFSVESAEMKTVTDGCVVLDANGEATVELPNWFESLNDDFRYQLTPIGGPAPNLHIAEPISDQRFRVAGGSEGLEVCWQVTGVRKDRAAQHFRVAVEEEKPPDERGYYLHPELYGEPEERGITWVRAKQRQRQMETQQLAGEDAERILEQYRQKKAERLRQLDEQRRRLEDDK